MSAKLEQAYAKKQVLGRKLVSGEVAILLPNNLKPIVLSHNGLSDLLSLRGVTVDVLRNSNLKELVAQRLVSVE